MPEPFWTLFSDYCLSVPWHGCCDDCGGLCLGPYDETFDSPVKLQSLLDTIQGHVFHGHVVKARAAINLVGICSDLFIVIVYNCFNIGSVDK